MTLVMDCETTQAEVGVEMERDLGPKEDGTQYSTDEVAASRAHFVTSRVRKYARGERNVPTCAQARAEKTGWSCGADMMPITLSQVWEAVGTVMPIIEMCGRRSSAECIAAQPKLGKLADALMAGGVVMGTRHTKETIDRAKLKSISTSLQVNGAEVAAGSTSECPEGGPIESLTWCANHLVSRGLALQKGQVVITGATCKSTQFKIGDTVTASLGALGSVAYTIAP